MARIITLAQPKEIEVVAAKKEQVESLKINYVVDYGNRVEAQLQFKESQKDLILWSSETTPTYEEIGQWTDENVDSRLSELL